MVNGHRTAADRACRDDVQRPAVDPHASERRMPMCESHSGLPVAHMAGSYAKHSLIGLRASAATLRQPGWLLALLQSLPGHQLELEVVLGHANRGTSIQARPTLLTVLCLRNWNPLPEGCEERMLSEPQAHHPGLKEISTWATDWEAAILSGQAMGGKMSWRADVGIWGGRVTPRDFPHHCGKAYYQPSRATGALLVVGVALSLPSNDPTPPRHLIIARPTSLPVNFADFFLIVAIFKFRTSGCERMSSCMERPSISLTHEPVQKRQDRFNRSCQYPTSLMLRLWAWDGGNFAPLWAESIIPTPIAVSPSPFSPRRSNCLRRERMYSVSDHEYYAGCNH
ncbi:uncharacterized protein An07g04440 [Aspergillus niger]|uniref:Contig An07c0100, genomic contig n=2 Tax=Aspergillus niger TaxID=5061 RepID=A2QN53_ASPNC|nr:uncharacterized protein An07g04440 [Aspergillus niger]CAK48194.1 unnamed protein product [Aspergillus niger]